MQKAPQQSTKEGQENETRQVFGHLSYRSEQCGAEGRFLGFSVCNIDSFEEDQLCEWPVEVVGGMELRGHLLLLAGDDEDVWRRLEDEER